MDAERWQRIKRLLDESAGKSPGELPAWLDQACGRDRELRLELESFLAYEDDVEAFSTPAAHQLLGRVDESADLGLRVGPFRIREVLGRGGMGVVYLAEREEGFEQRVALKIVPAGCEDMEILRRFYRERQILARLVHPNIAHLLDGGTSDDGRPYFAMELVEGMPIHRYCEAHGVPLEQRLGLALQVCDALRLAHRNLVVHRDLKPDNILVDEDGAAKLLDFGIAKQEKSPRFPLSEPRSSRGGFGGGFPDAGTAAGHPMPRTLLYASPEQLRNEPISTASDIYSLGLVLYQLLTGSLPFDLDDLSLAEAVRVVCEEEPPAPSEKALRSVGGKTAAKLHRRLRGDLDAIVLETLKKDPAERYSSVDQVVDDLHRHLAGLPVRVRRGSLAYAVKKYVRRYRWAVAAVAAFLILVLSFIAVLAGQLRRTERQRDRAARLSDFLVSLFRAAEPDRGGGEPSVRDLVDTGRLRLASELAGQPDLRAELLRTLGEVYQRLGDYATAHETLEMALAAQRRHRDGDDPATAIIVNDLAAVAYERGDHRRAEELYRQSIAMKERLGLEAELIKPYNNLASILMERGELDEAESIYRRGLAQRRAAHGDHHPHVASSLYRLGSVLFLRGDFDASEPLFEEALAIRVAVYGREEAATATVLASLGRLHHARGDLDRAETLYAEALAIRRRRLGSGHPYVAILERNLAALLVERGELDTAGVLLGHSLGVIFRYRPEGDWMRADAESIYGAYLAARGRFDEAETCLEDAYETLSRVRGPDVVYTREARRRLAVLEERNRSR